MVLKIYLFDTVHRIQSEETEHSSEETHDHPLVTGRPFHVLPESKQAWAF